MMNAIRLALSALALVVAAPAGAQFAVDYPHRIETELDGRTLVTWTFIVPGDWEVPAQLCTLHWWEGRRRKATAPTCFAIRPS